MKNPENVIKIKNMVCNRCILLVKEDLEKLNINFKSVELGEVRLEKPITSEQLDQLSAMLTKQEFEILQSNQSILIEKIKTVIIEVIHHSKEMPSVNFSTYLSEKLNYNYPSLSSLFSSVEGITIEKFTVLQKIQKIKELLSYQELTLSEIAFKLGYSNVQYLSTQFKNETGMTPSYFKGLQEQKRKPLDGIT